LRLYLESRTHGSITIVHCKGRITYRDEALALSAEVVKLLSRSREIVLDLSGVDVIDSAGLGELVVAFMSGQITGCPVKLAAPSLRIRQLLELTNLTSVFEIYPSVDQVLAPRAPSVSGASACQASA
jgi:anti-sigma B factor antagonist